MVIKVSIKPTEAAKNAYGAINLRVSKLNGRLLHNSNKFNFLESSSIPFKPAPPPSLIKSPTFIECIPPKIEIKVTIRIAVSAAGTFVVSFGSPQTINMVSNTKPIIVYNVVPCIVDFTTPLSFTE